METLTHTTSHERQRSFDPLASVRMMRYDLETFGRVLPETKERVCDEELSFLTEGIDRAARTEFALSRGVNGELQYFSKGTWRPYISMLVTGLEIAQREAQADPRKRFLADMAAEDLSRGYAMQSLQPGEVMPWFSAYREAEEQRYGAAFMRQNGMSPERKMGFLYRAECAADGTVILQSQTVDRAHDAADAFRAAVLQPDLDSGLRAYDEALQARYDRQFYAGRDIGEREHNAWETIRQQKDLAEYLLNKIEALAKSGLNGERLEHAVKQHIYGVWAAFKNRIDGKKVPLVEPSFYGYEIQYMQSVEREVNQAFREFVAYGRVLVGCGGEIQIMKGLDAIMDADAETVFDAIFGKKNEESNRLPALIRCINCKEKVRSKEVVKEKSWCCPKCSYEVDICNGRVICSGKGSAR